jgi:hypothetical protein
MAKKKPQEKKNELVMWEVVQNIGMKLVTDGRLILVWPAILLILGIIWMIPADQRSDFLLKAFQTNFVTVAIYGVGTIVIAFTAWAAYKYNQQRYEEMVRVSEERNRLQNILLLPDQTRSSKPEEE